MKRKIAGILGLTMIAFVAYSDDLTFDDTGSCWAPYGTNYDGYMLDSSGKKQIAVVEARESRGTPTGASVLKITVEPFGSKSKITLSNTKVKLPDRAVLTSSDDRYTAEVICNVSRVGNEYVGWMRGWLTGGEYENCEIRVGTPGIDLTSAMTIDPKLNFSGCWGIVFMPSELEGTGADVMKRGFPFVSVDFNKNGKVKATLYTPTGMKKSRTCKVETVGGNTLATFSFNNTYASGKETLGFKLVWNNYYAAQNLPRSEAISVQDITAWTSEGKKSKVPFSAKLIYFGSGCPTWSKDDFKSTKKTLLLPDGFTQDKLTLSYKSKTGIFSGKAKLKEAGSRKTVTMNIYGIEIDGQGWGLGVVKNKFSGWVRVVK